MGDLFNLMARHVLTGFLTIALSAAPAAACEVPDPAPHLDDRECLSQNSASYCANQTRRFSAGWDAAFMTGDLDALRFVALELGTDAFQVLDDNPTLACAFRRAITMTGDLGLTQNDFDQVAEGVCFYLTTTQRLASVDLSYTIRDAVRACAGN